jgi:hypothetical protein
MITNGIPAYWKKPTTKKGKKKKPIWSALSLKLNSLIFKENNGISAFKM